MKITRPLAGMAVLTGAMVLTAHAAPAHEHGKATLNLALEGKQLVVDLETPLDNLLGFEHAPRTTSEKNQASQMIKRLQSADGVLALPAAAKCALSKASLSSAALTAQLPKANPKAANPLDEQPEADHEGHADLDGEFTYTCQAPDKLTGLTVNLFKWFPHTQLIHVQWVNGNRQKAFQLTVKQPSLNF